jgi:hypothetical protein
VDFWAFFLQLFEDFPSASTISDKVGRRKKKPESVHKISEAEFSPKITRCHRNCLQINYSWARGDRRDFPMQSRERANRYCFVNIYLFAIGGRERKAWEEIWVVRDLRYQSIKILPPRCLLRKAFVDMSNKFSCQRRRHICFASDFASLLLDSTRCLSVSCFKTFSFPFRHSHWKYFPFLDTILCSVSEAFIFVIDFAVVAWMKNHSDAFYPLPKRGRRGGRWRRKRK